jgi:hypothetical protein
MVAAASWPFPQLDSSNSDQQDQTHSMLPIANSGVGPAKAESFEVVWNGKAYTTSQSYLEQCCGYRGYSFPLKPDEPRRTPVVTGTITGAVIRAGETRPFLSMRLGADNEAVWKALDDARFKSRFRICYRSVFDECWLSNLDGLHPARVDRCPVPKVPYIE